VTATKFGEYRRKKRRQPPVTVASLRLFLRSSTGPDCRFQPQSLGRVRDPVRIAEGPTAIDATTQRRHFGFRLRLIDNLQPIGVGGRAVGVSVTTALAVLPTNRLRAGSKATDHFKRGREDLILALSSCRLGRRRSGCVAAMFHQCP
jgi:hypothetical protein